MKVQRISRRPFVGMSTSLVVCLACQALFPGFGHVILSTGNECMAGMMAAFYADPLQEPDRVCLESIQPQWLE